LEKGNEAEVLMELTNGQLEMIREAAKAVEYGSITIHISATSKHFELEVQRRIRVEAQPDKKFVVTFNGKYSEGAHDPEKALRTKNF
jgi:L-alanine-DL-glutamate epimerase-like enolase superfamily enzyme